jgi:hypothetical protein
MPEKWPCLCSLLYSLDVNEIPLFIFLDDYQCSGDFAHTVFVDSGDDDKQESHVQFFGAYIHSSHVVHS